VTPLAVHLSNKMTPPAVTDCAVTLHHIDQRENSDHAPVHNATVRLLEAPPSLAT
jgi:hypothetical protein